MTAPITIESLDIQGFRAYLDSQSFSFRKGNKPSSLAIFAPNAKGKSSLVDAFEYFFSTDATLERLGRREAQSQAGRTALAHVRAQEKNVSPQVMFKFRQGSEQIKETRGIPSSGGLPLVAERVLAATKVPFVIHGYDLRGFVEASAEIRYRELAAWFSLDPLLSVQRNLRALQREVKGKVDSQSEADERLRDLRRVTTGEVSSWHEPAICEWFNTSILSALDDSLTLEEISETDPTYSMLVERKEEEDKQVGLASMDTLTRQIESLSTTAMHDQGTDDGLLASLEKIISDYESAVAEEANERSKASQSVFNDVWSKAHSLLEMDGHEFDSCPVCDTEFKSTPHGSPHAVLVSLNDKLGMLAAYRDADAKLRAATERATKGKETVASALDSLGIGLSDAGHGDCADQCAAYRGELDLWTLGQPLPESRELLQALSSVHTLIDTARQRLVAGQGESTYANAVKSILELLQIKADLGRIHRFDKEHQNLNEELVRQANSIETAIVGHTRQLISQLETDVNSLYQSIQGTAGVENPVTILLQMSDDDAANQQQVRLVIDYASNRQGVAPTGYLSDSQIHSLALALRLAAIRTFNTDAPIIVLDDVVTSYDADHRKCIASTLAEKFAGFQILVVTHDEQFFNLLRDHLPQSGWAFRRITNLDPDFGPVFADHHTSDEEIDSKLADGITAGEKIRQAEEEWLLKISREFGVSVRIREIERPYQYDRSELAGALAGFLKEQKLAPPAMPGIANSFLDSLQSGVVENFVSHFSDNPYRSSSVGDERTRWTEFKLFRELFVCPKCGRSRFSRPWQLKKPVCRHESCQTPFEFQATLSTVGDPP